MSSQEIIRRFYQKTAESYDHSMRKFLEDFQHSRIARLELTAVGEAGIGFDSVEIEQISQNVPSSIAEAFERHTWLSQHCLSSVYILKISVESRTTYALVAIGHVSDGWDGFCQLLEIFDGVGEFLGAAVIGHDRGVQWSAQPFDGDAFPGSPSCHWTGDATMLTNSIWSPQMAIRVEHVGSIRRLVFPWAEDA